MTLTAWIILSVVSLCFSALFSGVEIAYISADRVRVGLDTNRGGLINRIIGRYYSHSDFFISTILVGNNIMLVIYGMGAAALLEPWIEANISDNQAVILVLQTIVSTLVILFTGEFLPKSVFRINPNTSLKISALPVYFFYIVLYPVSWFTSWLSKMLMKLAGIKAEDTRLGVLSITDLNDYLETKIDDLENPQEVEVENEVKIFHNALDFSTTQLRDCMAPRNELVAVDIDTTTREELSELFTSSGRSKILVYKEDIDNVVGYVHVSELFDPGRDWKEHVKEVLYAPDTLLANTMMRRLLGEKRSMAVVVDEFGGTAGLVTLEDLVEEIFGDIQDEHDKNGLTATELSPGVFEFSGRIEVRTLRDEFRLDIPEDDEYQTLAGYIIHETGSLPAQDERIEIDGITFTIKARSATRLDLIRVETTQFSDKE
ncbi:MULTISPECIES: hemolysin family protein [Duncaniella]|jgi:CBS domain containing-hemolysin-like protein|uniref:HlyC/CorC family transporter n=1 Tax=Duncaniella dubosii TaxID=2518971 RepID=A0A4P7W2G0_9BACT|nr:MULTISPECIES: hemolysin family protein [Duncaniella]MBJ2190524.1 HlyC/CorC family transporter [Muribaculaceae bacterium]MCX4283073.1 hemolysin family protein [Duncaniella dubosii]QCD42136.1 HlyC/CorC family transporter [Duncaniella dubosii]HBN63080.1 hemolysin [Porphyromonadaceae bacterium]